MTSRQEEIWTVFKSVLDRRQVKIIEKDALAAFHPRRQHNYCKYPVA